MPESDQERKVRIEILIETAKFHRDRFNSRRSYQWKLNLALWSAVALLAGFLFTNELNTQRTPCCVYCFGLLLLLLVNVVYFYWTVHVSLHDVSDRNLARRWMREAATEVYPGENGQAKLKQLNKDALPPREGGAGWMDYSTRTQIAITLLLSAMVVIAAWARVPT